MTDDIRVLRKGSCTSLSSRSTLDYMFAVDDKFRTVLFRIADSTGSGHFQNSWIPLNDILTLLDMVKDRFSLSVFKPLYPGQSINNVGFLGAALMREGLIVCEKRRYLKKDNKAFLAELNKLIKKPRSKP